MGVRTDVATNFVPARPAVASVNAEVQPRHRFAKLTVAFVFLLLIAGGLVTSTGSALAVPDWPLSYGQFFPRMTGGVLFEHGHRLVAGTVAALTLVLAAWTVIREKRRWVRGVAMAAGGGILLQALLGGITVLYRLPPSVSIAHACLGQTVFCLLLCLAQVTSPWFLGAEPAALGALWVYGAAAFAAAYVQLVLGAVLRHGGVNVVPHLVWAVVVAGAAASAAGRGFRDASREPALLRPSLLILGLIVIQLGLGVAALAVRALPPSTHDFWRAVVPTAHVAVGAAILGTLAAWTLRAYRLK